MGVTTDLAAFAADTTPESIPADVRHHAYRITLDTLGVACGAVDMGPAQTLVDEVTSWGGAPEASILASGHRTSAVQAAYANAYLANLLDADETLVNHAHVANAVVAGALAVAERIGASGRELLDAVAIGFEIAGRIGVAYRNWQMVDGRPDWSAVTGYSWVAFGVAAAAGRLIGLDAHRMASAFGIAGYSTPIPSIGKWVDCTRLPNTKYVFLGPLAHAGVASILLAARGFTGDPDILDGDRGFWRMAGSASCDWAAMTDEIGKNWLLSEVAYKWYPACRFFHGPMDCFAHILAEEGLEPEAIDRIEVRLPPAATRPYFTNREPTDVVEGSFSVPHCFACLAYGVPVGPRWHADETLRRPDIARFRHRIEVVVDLRAAPAIAEQIVANNGGNVYRRCPTSLRVDAGGRSYEASVDYASGDPWSPETAMSDDKLEEKFSRYVSGALGAEWASAALASLRKLETLPDVRGLRVFDGAVGYEAGMSVGAASRL
ncbi:MAG: MmgE/PrpD family protein [Chloroflexi bacterium]|nr:MmgE/PrpD family protein [Chloroflexota bacterium]